MRPPVAVLTICTRIRRGSGCEDGVEVVRRRRPPQPPRPRPLRIIILIITRASIIGPAETAVIIGKATAGDRKADRGREDRPTPIRGRGINDEDPGA